MIGATTDFPSGDQEPEASLTGRSCRPHPGPRPRTPVDKRPNLPSYSVPTYASDPNSATYNYTQQYSASAWPYIGPFYPYPQVPMGWRSATLEWDDGYWGLKFSSRTNRWWWFLNPKNW